VRIQAGTRYGPLQPGFSFELERGYKVLIGKNNSGKSAILQLAFTVLLRNGDFGPDGLCLVLTDRDYVQGSAETQGGNLSSFNGQLLNNMSAAPLQHNDRIAQWGYLPIFLLNHTNTMKQLDALNRHLTGFGLPELILRTSLLLHFEDIPVAYQGSGLRSLLSILAALTDTRLRAILIDEPELSLEPLVQRRLRDLLIEASQSRHILIATHSHLFVNRSDPSSNLIVQNSGGSVSVSPVLSEEGLYDITFELLGNSLEDLFLPGNFLVVEGASDQIIAEKIRILLKIPAPKIKILAATGVEKVPPTVDAVLKVLVPVVTKDSPYAKKIVAMIDKPVDTDSKAAAELKHVLKERLFILSDPSIEEYVPDAIYTRINRNKADDLENMAKLKGNYLEFYKIKKGLSEHIAAGLVAGDLEKLPIIADAVRKAGE